MKAESVQKVHTYTQATQRTKSTRSQQRALVKLRDVAHVHNVVTGIIFAMGFFCGVRFASLSIHGPSI